MKHISELQTILSNFFDWHKCRLDCLGQIIQALFVVRIINLTQIASAFKSEVKEESSYRRVCRFFTGFTFDISAIGIIGEVLSKKSINNFMFSSSFISCFHHFLYAHFLLSPVPLSPPFPPLISVTTSLRRGIALSSLVSAGVRIVISAASLTKLQAYIFLDVEKYI